MKDSISAYFQDYPKSNKVFETSDGYLFHEVGDAKLHADTMANNNIEEHSRPAEAEDVDAEGKTKGKGKATK
jgi:hypothetical protein